MSIPKNNIRFDVIMAAIIVAVAIAYFLFGGDSWSPKIWVLFLTLATWIIIMNLRKDAGLENEKSYGKWKQQLSLMMVAILILSPFWNDSWWPFIIGLFLCMIWFSEYRQSKS